VIRALHRNRRVRGLSLGQGGAPVGIGKTSLLRVAACTFDAAVARYRARIDVA
jgi:hypothetical protein